MSDPRRPALEREVNVHPRSASGSIDYFGMLAMALGMCAMLTRVKLFAYAAILAQASSLATQSFAERDIKTVLSSLSISLLAIVTIQNTPQPPPPATT